MQEVLTRARESGADSANLDSHPSREAANRLYRRLGFVQHATNIYRFPLK
jgi:ribosomal protein S18 acetylase RimI-like enzyme